MALMVNMNILALPSLTTETMLSIPLCFLNASYQGLISAFYYTEKNSVVFEQVCLSFTILCANLENQNKRKGKKTFNRAITGRTRHRFPTGPHNVHT